MKGQDKDDSRCEYWRMNLGQAYEVLSQGIGFGIKREIFFLNLEDGYFGCQVNESTDVLQLYEVSKLCDGRRDCFRGSDELRSELKCSNLSWMSIGILHKIQERSLIVQVFNPSTI
ncbi:SCO-spondin [Frankliniella fusca]|uniref:SCO-spondin n=1 Tax=Frankliniella fusca TaxID=407009 RepID=A0AAE1I2U2_9NEOP|nr:SCO-spondin [Frankliniella fusca]